MDILKNCAVKFQEITKYKYRFVIGKKGNKKEFFITFQAEDFHHLAGLQYIRDNDRIRTGARDKIYQSILSDELTLEHLQKSEFYDKIEGRLISLSYLEEILDSNDSVYYFHKNNNKYTKINANYLLECELDEKIAYVFVIEEADRTFCNSQFFKDVQDYAYRQSKCTLLLKEKMIAETDEVVFTYRNPVYKET